MYPMYGNGWFAVAFGVLGVQTLFLGEWQLPLLSWRFVSRWGEPPLDTHPGGRMLRPF